MPEMYEVTCPHCERVYRLSRDKIERNVGREIRCKACNNPFLLPGLDAAEGEPPPFVPPEVTGDASELRPSGDGRHGSRSLEPATAFSSISSADDNGSAVATMDAPTAVAEPQPVAVASTPEPVPDVASVIAREPETPSGETVIETEVEPAAEPTVEPVAATFSRTVLGSPAPSLSGDATGREASPSRETPRGTRTRIEPPVPPPAPVYAMSRQAEKDIAIIRGWVRFWSVLVLTLLIVVLLAAIAAGVVWYFDLPLPIAWPAKKGA